MERWLSNPFYRWEEQGRTPKPALRARVSVDDDSLARADCQLAEVAPAGLPASPGTPLPGPPRWLRLPEGDTCQTRVRGRAGGGQGGFISTWHKVNTLWQEPDEQVAWDAEKLQKTCQFPARAPEDDSTGKRLRCCTQARPDRPSPGHLFPGGPHCALCLADSCTPFRLSSPGGLGTLSGSLNTL